MHREVIGAQKGQIVDHINRDGLDNRKSNLRFCNQSQNRANTKPTSKSGYKGVTKTIRKLVTKSYPRWHSVIRHNKIRINLGWFKDPISAAKAYDKKAKELHGEFAVLNFPEESKNAV
jgi:hypothetical protein